MGRILENGGSILKINMILTPLFWINVDYSTHQKRKRRKAQWIPGFHIFYMSWKSRLMSSTSAEMSVTGHRLYCKVYIQQTSQTDFKIKTKVKYKRFWNSSLLHPRKRHISHQNRRKSTKINCIPNSKYRPHHLSWLYRKGFLSLPWPKYRPHWHENSINRKICFAAVTKAISLHCMMDIMPYLRNIFEYATIAENESWYCNNWRIGTFLRT